MRYSLMKEACELIEKRHALKNQIKLIESVNDEKSKCDVSIDITVRDKETKNLLMDSCINEVALTEDILNLIAKRYRTRLNSINSQISTLSTDNELMIDDDYELKNKEELL